MSDIYDVIGDFTDPVDAWLYGDPNAIFDPLNEHKGVGGGDGGDNSYTSVGVDPSTLSDPTKFSWQKIIDAFKTSGAGNALFNSPGGLAALMAALGASQARPAYGGGTTQSYQGPAQLTRKIVQGPYGPVAEYEGAGGGAPDYTRFTPPTFAPAPPAQGGIGALPRPPAPAPVAAPPAPAPAPAPIAAPAPAARPLPGFANWVSTDLSGEEKAALFNNYLQRGYTGKELREAVEKAFGPQQESDWQALTGLAAQQPKDLLPTDNPHGLFKADIQQAVRNLTPTPAPRNAADLLPSDWATYDPMKKIGFFNQNQVTPEELRTVGTSQSDIDWMRSQGYKYARGGLVGLEHGGFVLTKRAVDGAGGPGGIRRLLPGSQMIRGPGTGTSDSIPATIRGPKGSSPALVSNGEARMSKQAVDQAGGPRRVHAMMKSLERKA